MEPKIRRLKLLDIPKLVMLVKGETSVEDYPGEYSADLFKYMLKDKNTVVLVVEKDKKVIAFQEFRLDKSQKRIYLETIVVSKEHRGRGIALMLVKKMEKFAKDNNYKRLSFLVRKWNKFMNSLAKKMGYKKKDELIFWEKYNSK